MTAEIAKTMRGVVLPGDSTVEFKEYPVPEPGHGQVLLKMKASSICGSDIRAIYREHLGHGPEAYQGVIAGHEPCGQIVAVGPGCKRFQVGDRVILYHISGCGVCNDCRRGYMISCTSRAARGLRLAARRRACRLLPGRGEHLRGAAGAVELRGRRADRVRVRHGVRGAEPHARVRRGPRADHGHGAGRHGRGHGGEGHGRVAGDRRGHLAAAPGLRAGDGDDRSCGGCR